MEITFGAGCGFKRSSTRDISEWLRNETSLDRQRASVVAWTLGLDTFDRFSSLLQGCFNLVLVGAIPNLNRRHHSMCALLLLIPLTLESMRDRVASVRLELELVPLDLILALLNKIIVVEAKTDPRDGGRAPRDCSRTATDGGLGEFFPAILLEKACDCCS